MSATIKQLSSTLIEIDNKIAEITMYINHLKQKKQEVENALIMELQRNNLTKHQITFNDKRLRICRECNYTPLSYKFLEQELNKLFPGEPAKIKGMVAHIKAQRQKRYSNCIKIQKQPEKTNKNRR